MSVRRAERSPERVMRIVYLVAIYLLAPLAWLVLVWRGLRDPTYREGLTQRFGFGPQSAAPSIWVHAVSVGEVQAAASLVQALRARFPDIPLTLTTVTPTGAARARAAPVGVTVVSVSGMSGNRARRACTSEAAACTSPTDTA